MKRKLWFALVEHKTVDGAQVQVFSQPAEPTDAEVLGRYSNYPKDERKQIYVGGVFDISAVIAGDDANMKAFKDFVDESFHPSAT